MEQRREKQGEKKPCPCKDRDQTDAMSVPMHGEKISDVLGSYTGMGKHGDRPVQDADDL